MFFLLVDFLQSLAMRIVSSQQNTIKMDCIIYASNIPYWLWTGFCCLRVCMFIFFRREGFFHLQDFRDILEGTDQRSCVVNINLGASAKFLHHGIWKYYISPQKTKTPVTTNWRENDIIYWRPATRLYILI